MPKTRVCVVGGGISGLSAAWALNQHPDRFEFELWEKNDYRGGNAMTVEIPQDDGSTNPIDISVTAYIPTIYNHYVLLLKQYGIESLPTRFSYSVRYGDGVWTGAVPRAGGEAWSGHEDTDAFGHARLGGIGLALEKEIEARTGFETRTTILGHTQRGGTPTAYDRVLATRFGVKAADALAAGESGKMVALRSTKIELVDIDEALAEPKLLDPDLYETAEVFFG